MCIALIVIKKLAKKSKKDSNEKFGIIVQFLLLSDNNENFRIIVDFCYYHKKKPYHEKNSGVLKKKDRVN